MKCREYPQKRYGQWSGDPHGLPYDPQRCAEAVFAQVWDIGRQCQRRPGHGDRGLFCKQHARATAERDVGGSCDE